MRRKSVLASSLSLLLLLTLFALPVLALRDDFIAIAPAAISACSCISFTDDILIQNTGEVVGIYTLSYDTISTPYILINNNKPTLRPYEYQNISRVISIPCSFHGTYMLDSYITSQFGLTKKLQQQITANQCNSLSVQPEISQTSLCSGTPAVYQFLITNVAPFEESFVLSMDFAQRVSYSKNPVNLAPGVSENVLVYVNTQQLTGSYAPQLHIEASKSGFSLDLPFLLQSTVCTLPQSPVIKPVEQQPPVANQSKILSPLTKKNVTAAPIPTWFLFALLILAVLLFFLFFVLILVLLIRRRRKIKTIIDATGEEDITQTLEISDLEEHEEQEERRWVSYSNKEIEALDKEVSAVSEPTRIIKEKKQSIFSFLSRIPWSVIFRVILLIIILFAIGYVVYYYYFQGATTELQPSTGGNGFLNLDLPPAENESFFTTYYNIIKDYFLTYLWYILAAFVVIILLLIIALWKNRAIQDEYTQHTSKPKEKKSSTSSDEIWYAGIVNHFKSYWSKYLLLIVLIVIGVLLYLFFAILEYWAFVLWDYLTLYVWYVGAAIFVLVILLLFRWFKGRSGMSSTIISTKQPNVKATKKKQQKDLKKTSIVINKEIILEDSSYLDHFKNNKWIYLIILVFIALLGPLVYFWTLLIPFFLVAWNYVVLYWIYLLLALVFLAIIIIVSKRVKEPEDEFQKITEEITKAEEELSSKQLDDEEKKGKYVVGGILLLLIILFGAFVYFTYFTPTDLESANIDTQKLEVDEALSRIEQEGLQNSFGTIIIPMNSFIEVNLSEHFYDPDGDELTFFVREPENVSVEIWKGIALLTPETNFYGVNYLTFYGEDPLGAQVNSSEVTVIVTYESQHLVWYVLYLPYILLGLVIVLVLIILAFIQRAKSE